MERIAVTPQCVPACPSCIGCPKGSTMATLEQVMAHADRGELLLGGDATRWPYLPGLLRRNEARPSPSRIWIEAPARALTPAVLTTLADQGVHGVLVQIEGAGEAMLRVLRAGDGERVIEQAEALGLATRARLCIRPKTFGALADVAARIAPRPTWIELVRQNWGGPPMPIRPSVISELMLANAHLSFSGHRMREHGYLPPCALPEIWSCRPEAFRSVLAPREEPNRTLSACSRCALAKQCHFADSGALPPTSEIELSPVLDESLPWEGEQRTARPVPLEIVKKRGERDIVCVTPWTTMEIVDPDGKTRQCCSDWTLGDRGNANEESLSALWNGAGYRSARRIMASAQLDELCAPVCLRLHDGKFAESNFHIHPGSEPFVRNQLLLAEDIAERREVVRGKPLRLALCTSTYCNYDCIMCVYGRTPRRDLSEAIWEQLPEFMPTLQSLTLLGGEPLANPLAMRFLREFDVERWPDVVIDMVTNGSLLTEKALSLLTKCSFGDITVSLNAGTEDVYAHVQRGIAFEAVLANLDALIRYRDGHRRKFRITAGFVVQEVSAPTLIEFGEIARERNLRIRLIAIDPGHDEALDFYRDPDAVARVVEHVDRFLEYCRRVRPAWTAEVLAVRTAILEEARARQAAADRAKGPERRLPILS